MIKGCCDLNFDCEQQVLLSQKAKKLSLLLNVQYFKVSHSTTKLPGQRHCKDWCSFLTALCFCRCNRRHNFVDFREKFLEQTKTYHKLEKNLFLRNLMNHKQHTTACVLFSRNPSGSFRESNSVCVRIDGAYVKANDRLCKRENVLTKVESRRESRFDITQLRKTHFLSKQPKILTRLYETLHWVMYN